MLKRLELDDGGGSGAAGPVRFTFDGREMTGRAGDSLAAALLANGVLQFRESAVSRQPRGPFCLMGVCFECLVEIDGVANWQACMVPLAEGMTVRSQRGGPAVVPLPQTERTGS
ncbi:2Fe-2S iron-sulfur cluster binding domain-containing protein [Tistlia consotensis]|uniref:2Fe-2S iron-sulfur cluster binding domain-containing protein n=1 Tax=Tistlia consotensis USBA 355 TaxID=560819 RepID=A0A1Y6CNM4_9PROT|nr:(2Fe-2S)-binding protein [Tistlia consotensis]SMF77076.1 2Fe-2S iron-sulfur cluster binding domain-containing protein [Tistlia consotensis USBA 355]SNS14082.1 2Fe-2S iron-sulfur cluster binding domain-containing protein [Tistlia consotensis]